MVPHKRSLAFLTIIAVVLSPLAAAHTSAPAPTLADELRAVVREQLTAQGIAWEDAAAAMVVRETIHPDGTRVLVEQRFDDHLESILGRFAATTMGHAGVPTTSAGDFFHVYVNSAFGSALAYEVTESAYVPSTPGVYLPHPAGSVFYDVGGTTKNVKGAYMLGTHTAGTVVGSSVEVSEDRVILPLVDATAVYDHSIDFVGHAIIDQFQFCEGDFCVAIGTLYATGVAQWDGELAGVGLPRVP